MTVYVDDMLRPARVGRIWSRWSHLLADTHDELVVFAVDQLGMRAEWIQREGTHREHFDLTERRRTAALRAGAVPISYPRETGELLARKRTNHFHPQETR
ncbi:DUF4031 domain-containing protein [Nocardioides sp. LHG3406-4]|uniref:DUF4031 domain-containing protein n=1 Tax=Nocardioides sp. LHG3406-4 TaxID=2804575 RepID=UPI003CF0EB82